MLIGLSGGRDSVALLYLLMESGYRNLLVAHIHHGLRGQESDNDETFVRELADKFDLEYSCSQVNILQRSKEEKLSIEHSARLARHEHFAKCMKSSNSEYLLLAHHRDDQAETILFNLLRGSSGLKGMHYHSELKIDSYSVNVLRPLLDQSRSQIDLYVQKHSINFREDSSNASDFATRNRLRNEALPLLVDIMKRDVSENLIRSKTLNDEQAKALETLLTEQKTLDPQGRIYLPVFEKLPIGAQRIILHDFLTNHGIKELSQAVIERCLNITHITSAAKTNLPGGKHLCRKEKRLFIEESKN